MATTIIGIYGEFQPAFSAKNELLASDFAWTQVSLNPDHEIPPRERTATPHAETGSVIGKLFTGLFDFDGNVAHSNVYAEAVRRGGYVVTADVSDEQHRARAEEIIQRYGPIQMVARPATGSSTGAGATPRRA